MKINFVMLKRFALTFVSLFIILTIIQMIFVIPEIDTSSTLESVYSVNDSLEEKEILGILNSGNVVNVIQKDSTYIMKTADGVYYQTDVNDNTTFALELAGLSVGSSVVKESLLTNPFFLLFVLLLVSFIINFIYKVYKEDRLMGAAEDLAYSSMQNMGEHFNAGATGKKEENTEEVLQIKKVTFDDIQGIDELKPDLHRLVACLKTPEKYQELGARMTKGLILYGPPGTGKTLIAKALAGEAGVPFFSVCGSDFMEKYVGVGASRIRDLYKKARKQSPCIIFIDEIDAIGGGRGEANSSEKDQTINALLAELDGFKSSDNVLTICATNRLDILDPALMRAGRFDLKLAVGLPDKEGRENILKLHSKNKKISDVVNIKSIAQQTVGFSGAELEGLLNESALIAADSGKECIDNDDIENAFFKIVMEGNKKRRKEIDSETYLIAYHEAGHALVTKLLTTTSVPTVTIIGSTSGAGGVTFMAPDKERLLSKKDLRNEIKISYAGRAAEELFLGNSDDITTGASQDIKSATNIIKSYISSYGMGDKGLIDIKQLTTQYDIVEEATELSNTLYRETLEVLNKNFDKLKNLAEALVEKETLYEEDINRIIGNEK